MNIVTKFKEWVGAFFPLTPDQGPQPEIVDKHSPLIKKKKLADPAWAEEAETTTDPYYEKMTKKELEEYARKTYNIELDRRHNKKRLINQIRKHKRTVKSV